MTWKKLVNYFKKRKKAMDELRKRKNKLNAERKTQIGRLQKIKEAIERYRR